MSLFSKSETERFENSSVRKSHSIRDSLNPDYCANRRRGIQGVNPIRPAGKNLSRTDSPADQRKLDKREVADEMNMDIENRDVMNTSARGSIGSSSEATDNGGMRSSETNGVSININTSLNSRANRYFSVTATNRLPGASQLEVPHRASMSARIDNSRPNNKADGSTSYCASTTVLQKQPLFHRPSQVASPRPCRSSGVFESFSGNSSMSEILAADRAIHERLDERKNSLFSLLRGTSSNKVNDGRLSACRTTARTEKIEFVWEITGWSTLRKLAKLKSLPNKDRLVSPSFGKEENGLWHLALFPYGDREKLKHVAVYLFSEKTSERIAEFSFSLLDQDLLEVEGTKVSEEATRFTPAETSWGWHEFITEDSEDSVEEHVSHDILRLKADVYELYSVTSSDPEPLDSAMMSMIQSRKHSVSYERKRSQEDLSGCEKTQSLMSNVSEFASNPQSHDVDVNCGGFTYPSNRFLLAARSTVLRAMLYGGFREGKSDAIDIQDVNPVVMEDLMAFLHTDSCPMLVSESPNVDCLLELYKAADKYQIMGLRSACEHSLAGCITNSTALDILQAAEERDAEHLTAAVYHFLEHEGSVTEVLKDLQSRIRGPVVRDAAYKYQF